MRRTEDNRLRTAKFHHLEMLHDVRLTDKGFAIIEATETIPDEICEFSGADVYPNVLKKKAGIHFYLDDYRFERVWTNPSRYLETLKSFKCVIQPDFSLYLDMPRPIQEWNKYRSNLLAAWWQKQGVEVIPNLVWSDEESFEFCFEGIPKHSVVATTAVGCLRNKEAHKLWQEGFKEALDRLLQQLNKYRGVLRFNWVFVKADMGNMAGGSSVRRNYKRELEQFRKFRQKWGSSIVTGAGKNKGQGKSSSSGFVGGYDFSHPKINVPIAGV